MLERDLRSQPFPTGVLREIAIRLPKGEQPSAIPGDDIPKIKTDKSQLSKIRGIDPDKVERYGRQILKLVRDTQKRYDELKKDEEDANGIVPDPNHHNVINLSSSDEYSDDDLFVNGEPSFDLNEDVVPSRFFTSQQTQSYDAPDEYQPGPSVKGSSTRKRQPSKRPRRKSAGESRPRARSSKPKAKSGERPASRSSFTRKDSKAKRTTSRIEMMPA